MLGIAYANRAKELGKKKDIDKALHHYRRALELNDKLYDAEYAIAMVYYHVKKDTSEAIKRLEKLVRKEPDYFQARFALGTIHYAKGNFPRALSVYENLHSDLERKRDSPVIEEMRKKCKENISLIQLKLAR